MTADPIESIDVVARVVAHLAAHPRVVAVLGDGHRVGGRNQPPYPRVRVTQPPGGSLREGRWLLAPTVEVEVLGDVDGSPGDPAMVAAWTATIAALRDLPDQPHVPGLPVVTAVTFPGGGGSSPEPNGQPRWLFTAQIHVHP